MAVEWWRIVIACVCLVLSGTFSGLTLGLMSLGVMDLRVLTESGTEKEKRYAKKILPVRKQGNFLLCTLLIGNTAVNSALSILTADIFGGLAGFLSSTVAILYFGEIIPQSVCHRYGLIIGAYAVPLVKLFMLITAVLSYPTAKLLDWLLGHEKDNLYSKKQLRSLLSIHGNDRTAEPDLENGGENGSRLREISPTETEPPEPQIDATGSADKKGAKNVVENAEISSSLTTNDSQGAKKLFVIPHSFRRVRFRKQNLTRTQTEIVERTVQKVPLTKEEMAIFGGAFDFGNKKVSQVMTHIDKVFMLDASLHLNFNVMLIIFQSGHSRIPVYEIDRSNIVGVLFAKDLILLDPEDTVPLKSILHFFNRTLLLVYDDTPLFDMLNIFKRGGGHLAVVQKVINEPNSDPKLETLGVATLEDLIEELIGEEIVDESDVYRDNVSRQPVKRVRSIDTEMLKMFDPLHTEDRLTEKEVLVVSSYLAHNTFEFSESCIREKILRETLVNAPIEEFFDSNAKPKQQNRLPTVTLSPITGSFSPTRDTATLAHTLQTQEQIRVAAQRALETENPRAMEQHSLRQRIGHKFPASRAERSADFEGPNKGAASATAGSSGDEDDPEIFIYKRGVPSFNAYLILNGRLKITAGCDGFVSEAGPWTLLGVHALVDDLYAPDFTARVLEKPARLLRISRKFYRLLQQYSGDTHLIPLVKEVTDKKSRVSPHTFERPLIRSSSHPGPGTSAGPSAFGDKISPVLQAVRRVSASTTSGHPIQWGEMEPAGSTTDTAISTLRDIVKAEDN